jgi:DNA polymerase-3 subunit epsilon
VRRLLLRQSPASPEAAAYARAGVGRRRTPWRPARYSVVDLEQSGLDPRRDEIISFAAIPIESGRVIAGGALYGLCRPTRPLGKESVLIHGIRTVDLDDAPPLDTAILPLIAAMTGRVLVAHAAWVEQSFLTPVLHSQGVRLRRPVLDTQELAQLLALERRDPVTGFHLTDLAGHLGLPVHRPHHALGDALTTAQVFLALATHLEEFAPETLESLARAKERVRERSMFPNWPRPDAPPR